MPKATTSRFQFTTPAAGAILGLVVGVADWGCLHFNWNNARAGLRYVPPFTWLTVIATSATLCCLVAALLASPRVAGLRAIALALAGPGVLLASRLAAALRRWTGGSTAIAVLICAIAIAVIAGVLRRLPTRPSRFNSAWIAASLLSAVTLGCLAWNPAIGRSRSEAPHTRQPNVVLIFLDTVRYDDALGGLHPAMPQLRAFANRSTSYENAWAPAPWTVPSHLAVLSGRDPWAVDTEESSTSGVTLAERFRARGYETAAISANPIIGTPDFFRGYAHFTYSNASGVCRSALGSLLSHARAYGLPPSPVCGWFTAEEITRRAGRFITSASRPFFLTLNYIDGHYPYYVPAECRDLRGSAMSRRDREIFHKVAPATAPQAVLDHAHTQYRAALSCMDRSLGALLAGLERDPDTIIAVVGDHGEQFGEHGLVEHGNAVYRQVLQVPLVIRAPREPNVRSTTPMTITDLYGLILRSSGTRSAWLPRPVVSSYYVWSGPLHDTGGFSAVAGDFHYIHWRDGREALFNYVVDPAETRAIPASDPPLLLESLRSQTSRAAAEEQRLNEFRALGYIQ